MPTLEERVSYLEGKVQEQSRGLDGVRGAISQFEVRMDRRFEAVDRRFEAVDRRFEAMDRRFDALDHKISRQFVWLVGAHVTTLVTVVATLIAAFFAR